MSRPAGGLEDFAGRVGSRQEVFEISRVGSGREVCQISRVGSGRVGLGRVGSGFVGSGTLNTLTESDPSRERRSDP